MCCLRMTALRPVIVVRSSVQKPATSARRDSARIDRPAAVGIVLAPCRTPAAAAPTGQARTKMVGRSPTVLVRRQWKRFLPLRRPHRRGGAETWKEPLITWDGCRVLDTRSHDDHWTKCRHPLMSHVKPRARHNPAPARTPCEGCRCDDRATVGASPETSVNKLLFAGSRMSVFRLGLSRSEVGRRSFDRPQG